MVNVVRTDGTGPDYSDESLAIGYQWIRGKAGHDATFGAEVLEEMQQGLAAYARERGAQLVGDLAFDFPNPSSLPPAVRRETRRAMLSEERRPWRWPGLVLVRAWQDTVPVTS